MHRSECIGGIGRSVESRVSWATQIRTTAAADDGPRRRHTWSRSFRLGEPARTRLSIGAGFMLPRRRRRQLNDRLTLWMNLPTIGRRLRRLAACHVQFSTKRPTQRAAPLRPVYLEGGETSCACQHRTPVAPRLRQGLFLLEEPASLAAHDEHLPLYPVSQLHGRRAATLPLRALPSAAVSSTAKRSPNRQSGAHRVRSGDDGFPAVPRVDQYRRS
ncbi:MAG: hypothetical protein QOF73_4023 [Thermomicrobiales bacterium]|jgi:hypothetical protein|nr:hypothetical protein [Thermomicrobiales bacterium]